MTRPIRLRSSMAQAKRSCRRAFEFDAKGLDGCLYGVDQMAVTLYTRKMVKLDGAGEKKVSCATFKGMINNGILTLDQARMWVAKGFVQKPCTLGGKKRRR